ncbi:MULTISPECIES: phosphoribosyltransferase [unclassified Archaeoglobus]|jgi:predicted phosphoribosyltransferase|uniref:phosphoribosyltransferase n=1 Tax=unclassified Archaeoglobus TaxID=2643606 RepID=UPI0025BE0BAE|nr:MULTISPECIES: phosphoribosyltransferase [unclassified Archaeoglobus]
MFVIQDKKYYNKFGVFRNRTDAGNKLADLIVRHLDVDADKTDVVAIPAGGVPVASAMAKKIGLKLKVLLVSKILFPWTTEAGFGALSMFGEFELNESAVHHYKLSDEVVKEQIKKTEEKIAKRLEMIPEECLIGEGNELAFLVDDGLASGYTMLVALKSARRFYDKIYVAVPTASSHAVDLVSGKCDGVFCINLRDIYPYAVADAYLEWHDVSDEEMLEFLK